jgi:cytochrome c oxidase assembly protein subunit 15
MNLRRLAAALCVLSFALVLAGGTVTSTGSGDDVPTWPFPIAAFGIEMTHRHVAGLVGILTLVLAGAMLIEERRAWVRRLGVAAAILVLAQAGLGGARVLWGPSAGTSAELAVVHAVIAQIFFCLTVLLALFTRPGWDRLPKRQPVAVMTLAILLVQLILGAVVRHTGSLTWVHGLWAAVVVASVLRTAARLPFSPAVGWLLALTFAQAFLGMGVALAQEVAPGGVLPRALGGTAHVGLGALMLACAAVLSFRPREPEWIEAAPTPSLEAVGR